MSYTRREILRSSGLGLLAFGIAGCSREPSPAAARDEVVFKTLTRSEVAALDSLGESLVPGAAAAGLSSYIDLQLSGTASNSMLMAKYLGLSPPFLEFYRTGLAGFAAAARRRFNIAPESITRQQSDTLLAQIAAGEVPDWAGPSQQLFYFALRSDAVDVVYGTVEGFGSLKIPYMAHIPPSKEWGS
ncbi:MAG: gluconate 2-dehydrogenase subunit 3 family protein [Pseudomonadota bacterium]|nr:gluconate 2-dehydrogenase subunit 3 family protein [Pseudomonadota bacterium]